MDLTQFFAFHASVVATKRPFAAKRYLFEQIDWSENGITIIGDRGVGKTTMLIQYAREQFAQDKWLYLSGDHFALQESRLYQVVEFFFKTFNGSAVFIDEIHKYSGWKTELKNILDAFGDKKILVSGSSAIHLRKGSNKDSHSQESTTDLERRRSLYTLEGLSLREFINFKYKTHLVSITLDDIVDQAWPLSMKIKEALDPLGTTILSEFESYLDHGYYPYFLETGKGYQERLIRTIDSIIASDIAHVLDLNSESVDKLKKLFAIIASSKPFTPNIQGLAKDLGVTRQTVYSYISHLQIAGLIRTLYPKISKAGHIATKAEKICIANPNILQALRDSRMGDEIRGTLRETFFVAAFLKNMMPLTTNPQGDFSVGDRIFEIGGPNKNLQQIHSVPNSFVVKDQIDVSGNPQILPLWLFGFLY